MQGNGENEIRIRRLKNNIDISGQAIMLFGAWGVIKALLMLYFDPTMNDMIRSGTEDYNEFERRIFFVLFTSVIVVILVLIFLFYYMIGKGAVRYARGEKKSARFIVPAAVLLVFEVATLPGFFTDKVANTLDASVWSLLVELGTCFMLFDMIYSYYAIKRISKKM